MQNPFRLAAARVAVLLLLIPAPMAFAEITFNALATYPTGQNPNYVAVKDLNGDGAIDVVVVNNSSNTVSVLLNKKDGSGALASPVAYSTGSGPMWAAIADINGDGREDIVTANVYGGNLSLLLGNGDGTFQAAQSIATVPDGTSNPYPDAVAAGDVNGDGHMDLVAANSGPGTVAVLLGDGAGHFGLFGTYAVGASPDSVSLARLRSGGHLDIITANKMGRSVSVLLGNGNGTFQAAQSTSCGYVPYSAIARDFSGDGIADVITCDNQALYSGVNLLKGTGDGTLAKATYTAGGKSPVAAAVGDFNGDGRLDVATVNTGTQDVSVFLNDGTVGFTAPISLAAGTSHLGIALADMNGDGLEDLVLSNSPSGVSVLLNETTTLQDLALSATSVPAGGSVTGRISLSRAAPAAGASVTVSVSDGSLVWAPQTVTVDSGSSSATFHIVASAGVTGTATVTASLSGLSVSRSLEVTAAPSGSLKGDLNSDGKVDILDVQLLMRVVGGTDVFR